MKQETLEEAAEKYVEDFDLSFYDKIEEIPIKEFGKEDFIAGAKWQQKRSYSEEDMLSFAEFVATYLDKNRNVNGEMLHAKSKYDGAERTIDLLKQYKK
jgi:hypothetical protein